MQDQNNTPPLRRRRELLEEQSAEGALTRAARPTPREATERAGARRLGQARPRGAAEPPEELRGWLSGRGNLRRAMLLQVVLGPPKALSPAEEPA